MIVSVVCMQTRSITTMLVTSLVSRVHFPQIDLLDEEGVQREKVEKSFSMQSQSLGCKCMGNHNLFLPFHVSLRRTQVLAAVT